MPKRQLRLFPLNAVLFPGAVLHLHVFEPRYKQLIDECLAEHAPFGVVLISQGGETGDHSVTPHDVGTIAEIRQVTRLAFERYYVGTIGCQRFRIEEIVSRQPYLTARVDYLAEERLVEKGCANLADEVRIIFREYLRLLVDVCASDAKVDLPPDARGVSYIAAEALRIANPIKQRLLELSSTNQRLTVEIRLLRRLVPRLRKLLEGRQAALDRGLATARDPFREGQDRLFGKHFSVN